jgi:hypothetical protein
VDKENVYKYTLEDYSVMKETEIMLLSVGPIELEVITSNELSQMQKDMYHVFYHSGR